MKKIFLDIGGHSGQAIHAFYEQVPDAMDWQIFSFEPIQYAALVSGTRYYDNVECLDLAVGIENGKIQMFPAKAAGQGSTIMSGKLTGDLNYENTVPVNCVNFVEWFGRNIKPDSFVIVKMNIEGGEYLLMPELPKILDRVAGIYLKLHHTKFDPPQRIKFESIYKGFLSDIIKHTAVVYCDLSENNYDFQQLLRRVRGK